MLRTGVESKRRVTAWWFLCEAKCKAVSLLLLLVTGEAPSSIKTLRELTLPYLEAIASAVLPDMSALLMYA